MDAVAETSMEEVAEVAATITTVAPDTADPDLTLPDVMIAIAEDPEAAANEDEVSTKHL